MTPKFNVHKALTDGQMSDIWGCLKSHPCSSVGRALSWVPPISGSRIWCNILKNSTNGMPDSSDIMSYLACHWLDFSGYCIISWNLKFVKPDWSLEPNGMWQPSLSNFGAHYLLLTVVVCSQWQRLHSRPDGVSWVGQVMSSFGAHLNLDAKACQLPRISWSDGRGQDHHK